MNKKHTPSFLLSVFIHIAAGLIVYFTYQLAVSLKKDKKKEALICMSLSTCEIKSEPKERPKQVQKPTKTKKVLQKKVPKLVVAKPVIPKKKIIQSKKIKQPLKQKTIPKKLVKTPSIKPTPPEVIKEVTIEENSRVAEVAEENISQTNREQIKQPIKELNTTQKTSPQKNIPDNSSKEKYINNHLNEISHLLADNLYYPRRARKKGIVGEVVVKFLLDKNGDVDLVEIVSSKHAILSRAAKKTIEDLSGSFPKPDEELELQIPIIYSLHN